MSIISITSISVISFVAAFIVGAFAQASRMCFIGGWRDFFLIRDTYLLKGFFSFVITAAILFFAFHSAGYYLKNYPWYDRPPTVYAAIGMVIENVIVEEEPTRTKSYCDLLTAPDLIVGEDINVPGVKIFGVKIPNEVIMFVIAAFVIGFCSTLANGCPLRQHVMAASGSMAAILFILSFYAAVLVYDKYLVHYFDSLIN